MGGPELQRQPLPISKEPNSFTFPNGDTIPLLKGDRREKVCELLIKTRLDQRIISLEEIVKTVYPDDSEKMARLKLRFLLFKMRGEWESSGWTIDNPTYIDSNVKLRRKQGFLELRKKEEAPTMMKRVYKKRNPPNKTANMSSELPTEVKTASSPFVPWQQQEKKIEQKGIKFELSPTQQEALDNLTSVILEHMIKNSMESLPTNIEGFLKNHLPEGILFDNVLGIFNNQEESFLKEIAFNIRRIWGKKREELPTKKEKQILVFCKVLGSKEENSTVSSDEKRELVIQSIFNHFGVELKHQQRTA